MKNTKRNRIIESTINCINDFGIENTTIRKIADTAGMNSAAISYYFDSKDKLIEKALETTLDNAFDWEDFKHLESLPLKERLFQIYLHLMEGALAYKGIARAHYHDTFASEEYETVAVRKINEFLGMVLENIRHDIPFMDEGTLRTSLIQLTYATMVSAGFMPGFFNDFMGKTLEDRKYREFYLHTLIEKLFS
jgi:AcrR family transcriptional regulator